MCFNLTSSNSSIRKNPANPNKHVNKNLKSGIVEFFPPYFVTKVLIIPEVLSSFLVVSVSLTAGTLQKLTEQKDCQ